MGMYLLDLSQLNADDCSSLQTSLTWLITKDYAFVPNVLQRRNHEEK